jgi:Flp pilus assembly protein TadD
MKRLFADLFLRLSLAACAGLTACASMGTERQPTLTTDARLQVAEAADASGDSALAISMYTAAAANEPSNIALQLRCADALARNGKITQARQILTDRLRTTPRQPDLTRALALVNLVAGQPAQAIAEFDQMLASNPGDIRALVDKAVALDLQGQHAEAQAIYRQVLATSPNDAATRNDLAISMMLDGRPREALETLAPMQDADAAPQRLKVNLGILYAATGNAERSRQLLGDRISDGDLSALTRALAPLRADGRTSDRPGHRSVGHLSE